MHASRACYNLTISTLIIVILTSLLWSYSPTATSPLPHVFSRPSPNNVQIYSHPTGPEPPHHHYPLDKFAAPDIANPPHTSLRPELRQRPSKSNSPPIIDNFPSLTSHSDSLPPIPPFNTPPTPPTNYSTPLFIPFTRSWLVLQQCLVSYITAGWPPSQIYVVDNSGTMLSNAHSLLTLQNPFYLNHTRLTSVFGVNVLQTPTRLHFSQLQNFLTFTALTNGWDTYFWSHMDVFALSDEEYDYTDAPYKSLYMRAVDAIGEAYEQDGETWATRWFNYDYLTLVRTQAYVDVRGWDTSIPFYSSDCDMHERLWMHGFTIRDVYIGHIGDVSDTIPDLGVLFERSSPRISPTDESLESDSNSQRDRDQSASVGLRSEEYYALLTTLEDLEEAKRNKPERISWQTMQSGGQGEPFHVDDWVTQIALDRFHIFGESMFEEKWGSKECNLRERGLRAEDAWLVVKEGVEER